MLAVRTTLVISGLDEAPYLAARTTAADAVTLDLAAPAVHGTRAAARKLAAKHSRAIAAAGRAVHVRLSDTRSGELDADAAATVSASLTAVVLSGAEIAQDARDADVAIRKQEMRRDLTPGSIRLIVEIDSAAGLRALPAILRAVDRHSAVALNLDALREDLLLPEGARTPLDHAMWEVAIAARDGGLPWTIHAMASSPGERSAIATRAHEYGAAGAAVGSDAEARGLNALFTPSPETVAAAQRAVEEWERLHGRGHAVGVSDGALVDRRRVRRARALIALAEAIERRERA